MARGKGFAAAGREEDAYFCFGDADLSSAEGGTVVEN